MSRRACGSIPMAAAGLLAAITMLTASGIGTAAEPGDSRELLVEARALSRLMQRMYRDEPMVAAGVADSKRIPVPYLAEIEAASRRYRIPKPLIAAVIKCESNWDRWAQSPKGARGLMQVLPRTALTAFGVPPALLWDPAINIPVGAAYLRLLAQRYGGRTAEVLAAYNAGPTRVDARRRLPRETLGYQRCVGRWYGRYARLLRLDRGRP